MRCVYFSQHLLSAAECSPGEKSGWGWADPVSRSFQACLPFRLLGSWFSCPSRHLVLRTTLWLLFCAFSCPQQRWFPLLFCRLCFLPSILTGVSQMPCHFLLAASDLDWPPKYSHDVITGKDSLDTEGYSEDLRVCTGSGGRRSRSRQDFTPW